MATVPRGPRPAEDIRARLLTAGADLIGQGGVASLSLRDAAGRAGVNQAMIRYYFGDRLGYLSATMAQGFDALLAQVSEQGESLANLDAAIAERPWLLRCMSEAVLDRGPLAGAFARGPAPKLAALYDRILAANADRLRPAISPVDARAAMIALLIYPRLAGPVWAAIGNPAPCHLIETLLFTEPKDD